MTTRPLQVGVAELRRHLGDRRPVSLGAVLDGLAVSTAAVPDGAEVAVELELESISNGVVAEGSITAPWHGECRRCLGPVEGRLVTEVREIFERHPVEGETYPLGDDLIDLEPMVRDAVLLALPLAPLCASDCPGPAPEAFPTSGADAGVRPGVAEADPRWAALDELRFDSVPEGDQG